MIKDLKLIGEKPLINYLRAIANDLHVVYFADNSVFINLQTDNLRFPRIGRVLVENKVALAEPDGATINRIY